MLPALQLLLQDAGFGFGIAFILLMMLFVVGGFVLWIGLAYWTYNDAQKRNMDDPIIWALIVFAAGVFGLVAYLLIRED